MKSFNINARYLPLGVNTTKYRPLEDKKRKRKLREKYSLPLERKIILHVGHINKGRNLEALIPLQKNNIGQVVIVGSTSTPTKEGMDLQLKEKLLKNGVIVIDRYLENIEEIYQLSDIYVFPVKSETGSIGLPLSVLEGVAAGLPVVTTDPQGGIELLIKRHTVLNRYIHIVGSIEGMHETVETLLNDFSPYDGDILKKVRNAIDWKGVSKELFNIINEKIK